MFTKRWRMLYNNYYYLCPNAAENLANDARQGHGFIAPRWETDKLRWHKLIQIAGDVPQYFLQRRRYTS